MNLTNGGMNGGRQYGESCPYEFKREFVDMGGVGR